MDVRNCKSCRRLFNYIGGQSLCPSCLTKLEDKFQEVKKYIEENPLAPITQVAEEMEISVGQLKQWVREERLSFSEQSVVGIECESCGVMIKTGRFCDKCKNDLANTLNSAIKKKEPAAVQKKREEARMRFLDGR